MKLERKEEGNERKAKEGREREREREKERERERERDVDGGIAADTGHLSLGWVMEDGG